jgi:hypothetical protein
MDPTVAEALRLEAAVSGGESEPGAPRPRMREAKTPLPEMHPAVAHAELELMLSAEPPPVEQDTFRIKRLTDHYRSLGKLQDDQYFTVTLRGLTDQEFERLRDRSLREPNEEEKQMQIFAKQRDPDRMNLLLVTSAVVAPDMRAPALLQKYGRPEDVIRSFFNPGEIFQLASWVNDLSGWSNAAVERSKKS